MGTKHLVVRIMAGSLLLAVGLDKLFGFYPLPTGTAEADAFVDALDATGYMMPLIAFVEIIAALSFLSGRYVPFSAIVIAPVSVNAFLFHLFLSPAAMVPTTLLLVLNLTILVAERRHYRQLFRS